MAQNKKSIFTQLIAITLLILSSCKTIKIERQEVDCVNPLIGAARKGWGAWYPCVGPPFAMTNFTPQTNENIIGRPPYFHEDSTIIGFMGTRQPAQWMGDYGYVSIMPVIGNLKVLPSERKVNFKHLNEISKAYYYSVKMDMPNDKTVRAEMAATERCSILKFTFPKMNQSHLIVQALNIVDDSLPDWQYRLNSIESRSKKITAYIKIDTSNYEIAGFNPDRVTNDISAELPNFKGYFIIQFSKPFKAFGTWNNDSINSGMIELSARKRLGAYISFSTKEDEVVSVKIATSLISYDQARKNLELEIPDWDFDKVKNQTRDNWQENLSQIKIAGASVNDRSIFYTAMFHSFLLPREIAEYGKYYSSFDDSIHPGISYTDFSLWDTFRALHPFLVLTQPERVNSMITAMLQMYQQGGWLPIWPNPGETNVMIGTHADAVIADAYVKGVRNYDVELAYEAMFKNAMTPPFNDTAQTFPALETWNGYKGRPGLTYYKSLGYVPSDKTEESVSRTLEYAYDDFCVAQVAKGLHKTADYNLLMKRSLNYKNVYNAKTGFMAPRLLNGNWANDATVGFTEGSPWTYLFCVMQDIPGLIQLMGGERYFSNKLDENFANDHYRHENEPGHHYIYLYDYCRQASKTQALLHQQLSLNYQNAPGGINGNDDCGQMSAWYLFSALGFYPVTPGTDRYALGVPHFPKTVLYLKNGANKHPFEIIAKNLSPRNKYVQHVTLDGNPLSIPFITHAEILNGKSLVFIMGPVPTDQWIK